MRDPEALQQIRTVALARKAYVPGDGQVRKEAVVLGEVADAAPLRGHVHVSSGVEPGLAAKHDPPGERALQAGDGPQQ